MTPDELLRAAYEDMVTAACTDIRANRHVPSCMVAIVTSPWNPPELHVMEILDPRQAPHMMRAAVKTNAAIFGFVFLTVGTTLHEQPGGLSVPHDALLCLWCTAHAAGGDSFRIVRDWVRGVQLGDPEPLPDMLQRIYRAVFNPAMPLPPMLTPTPH